MGKEMEEGLLQSLKIDALLLSGAANMRYLSGFTGEGYVYLSKNCRMVVTDSRYTIATKAECEGFEVNEWGRDGYYTKLAERMRQDRVKKLGFEDQIMTVSYYERMKEELAKAIVGGRVRSCKGACQWASCREDGGGAGTDSAGRGDW